MSVRNVEEHFSAIAPKYEALKTADIEPVLLIKDALPQKGLLKIADVGCGTGRYDVVLFKELGSRLFLVCIDNNERMLSELERNMMLNGITNFEIALASATDLPLEDESMDAIVTFNAIHHFDVEEFLQEVSRVLKKGGNLFIYTRLKEQNARNIWGRFFPFFVEKESRLFEKGQLEHRINTCPQLSLENVKEFRYDRTSRLEDLVEQAKNRHYSTFYFYEEKELERAIKKFEENLLIHFDDPNQIEWEAENIMYVARKTT